ncbi:MAG TPA: hypothetical protein VJ599_00880 [Nitrososphaeraceae archaeon]|nr:hypothetical protein [Nitrososphaeraceae archaeon]
MNKCDMCGSAIINNKCSCGEWTSKDEVQRDPYWIALEKFHYSNQIILTGDAPHLGAAVVFFRGDYNDTKEVEEFILKMKSRPYYNEMQYKKEE